MPTNRTKRVRSRGGDLSPGVWHWLLTGDDGNDMDAYLLRGSSEVVRTKRKKLWDDHRDAIRRELTEKEFLARERYFNK